MTTALQVQLARGYRAVCDACNGRRYSLPSYAKSWDSAEPCRACKGEGVVCASCGESVPTTDPLTAHGCVGPADPADVLAIQTYYGNLPRYVVDEVWTRNGRTYCQVSLKHRSAECPPDVTVYRYEIVPRETAMGSEDVILFVEVGWVNGVNGETVWNDEAEQAYPENGR